MEIALAILGSGPAGYSAGVYAARANLNPVLFLGSTPGGQLTTTTDVENWPGGRDGLTGPELMTELNDHASRMGVTCISEHVTEIDLSRYPFYMKSGDQEHTAKSIIIATGASARYLGIDSEQRLLGKGVSACATCDGFFYKGKIVAVVGGGNTAVEEALYLAKIAKKVYLVHRRDTLRAEAILQERLAKEIESGIIEPIWNHAIAEVLGDSEVTGIRVTSTKDAGKKDISLDGVFIAIGHTPNTQLFEGQLNMDHGYLVVGKISGMHTQTNIEGIFAAGDVSDPIYRQAITSAGSGCMAALDANRFLNQ